MDYDDDDFDFTYTDDDDDDLGLTPLAAAAHAIHEVYESLVDAGFTEHEGLRIITWLIVEEADVG